MLACSCVVINIRWLPINDVCATMDPLHVVRALCITVTCSVLCASILAVLLVLADTAILLHLHEVQGTVQTTVHFRIINSECEFAILHVEHLVLVLTVHHVQARSDIGGVR